jgi:cation diffusion facilitator CzcD-associated flavoprotein CzcO
MTDVDVVVVGAGFAGLYVVYRLRRAGYSMRVFEAAATSVAPGIGTRVLAWMYQMYSFDPDWRRDWQWSEKYATQPEILRYLNHVADKHDLRRHIDFSTRVVQAWWDDHASVWHVCTERGDDVTCRFSVMATGCLSMPKEAEIDGLARFGGEVYFSSRWPRERVDFTGNRVAVIGTGSSGVQSIRSSPKRRSEWSSSSASRTSR